MHELLVASSVALLLTALFAFRHDNGRRPGLLGVYFVGFFGLEWYAETRLLPPGTIPVEVAYVCFPLAAVFGAACWATNRYRGSLGG